MCLAGSASAAELKGWKLEQVGDVIGTRTLSLAGSGLRLESKSGGYITVAQGPDWNVFVFSPRSKKYYTCPLTSFKGEMTARIYAGDRRGLSQGTWTSDGTTDKFGVTADVYRFTATQSGPSAGSKIKSAQYCVIKNAHAPDKAIQLLGLIYQLPSTIHGIPLFLKFRSWDENVNVKVVRTSEAHQTSFKKEDFTCPSGYTRVTNPADVYIDATSRQAYEGFTDWIDGDLKGESRKKHHK